MARKRVHKYDCGVYQIRNILDGKIYVGQSIHLRDRKSGHYSKLRKNTHGNPYLQRAYNKYGEENFVFEILIYCEEFELTKYENFFKNLSNGNCYNIRPVCDSNKGIKRSDATKKRLSEAKKGIHPSDETRRKLSIACSGENAGMWGRHHTQETKDRWSRNKKGISINKGNTVSPETRQKISATLTGRKMSDDAKAKQSDGSIGRKQKRDSNKKYVGTFLDKRRNTWRAEFRYKNIIYTMTGFKYEIEAAICYNNMAMEIAGYKARLNEISQEEIDTLWELE